MQVTVHKNKSIGGYCFKDKFEKVYSIEEKINEDNFNNEISKIINKHGSNATDFYLTDNNTITIRYFRNIDDTKFNKLQDEEYFNDRIDGIEYEIDFLFKEDLKKEYIDYMQNEILKIINNNMTEEE